MEANTNKKDLPQQTEEQRELTHLLDNISNGDAERLKTAHNNAARAGRGGPHIRDVSLELLKTTPHANNILQKTSKEALNATIDAATDFATQKGVKFDTVCSLQAFFEIAQHANSNIDAPTTIFNTASRALTTPPTANAIAIAINQALASYRENPPPLRYG